jgi:hypothetical protein
MNDQTEEGLKVENGLLFRRCVLLHTLEIRLRAALELATGVPWDSYDSTDLSQDKLDELVAQNISRGLRIPMAEARKRVRENKASANPTQVETPISDEIESNENSR